MERVSRLVACPESGRVHVRSIHGDRLNLRRDNLTLRPVSDKPKRPSKRQPMVDLRSALLANVRPASVEW